MHYAETSGSKNNGKYKSLLCQLHYVLNLFHYSQRDVRIKELLLGFKSFVDANCVVEDPFLVKLNRDFIFEAIKRNILVRF
jgi:hypothetical protein